MWGHHGGAMNRSNVPPFQDCMPSEASRQGSQVLLQLGRGSQEGGLKAERAGRGWGRRCGAAPSSQPGDAGCSDTWQGCSSSR